LDNQEVVFKRTLKLPAAIGDWTQLKIESAKEKAIRSSVFSFDRLGEQELKKIHLTNYKLAENLLEKLSYDLKMKLILRSITAEQENYRSFINKCGDKVVQVNISIDGEHGFFLFFDFEMMDFILNRSLGGNRGVESANKLSMLDKEVIKNIILEHYQVYSDVWSIPEVPSSIEVYGPDKFTEVDIDALDGVVNVTMNVGVGQKFINKILIMYSNKTLRALFPNIEDYNNLKNINLEKSTVRTLMVPISLVLGNTELSMKDLHKLEKNDVIKLNQKIGENIKISLGDAVQLQGQMGSCNEKIAVQILKKSFALDDPKKYYKEEIPDLKEDTKENISEKSINSTVPTNKTNEENVDKDNTVVDTVVGKPTRIKTSVDDNISMDTSVVSSEEPQPKKVVSNIKKPASITKPNDNNIPKAAPVLDVDTEKDKDEEHPSQKNILEKEVQLKKDKPKEVDSTEGPKNDIPPKEDSLDLDENKDIEKKKGPEEDEDDDIFKDLDFDEDEDDFPWDEDEDEDEENI